MNGKLIRDRLLASTIIAGTVAFAAPAFAQDAATAAPAPSVAPAATTADTSAPASGGDIVVTGSRIPHPDLESASPVTVVGAKDFKLTGTTRTEDLLNSLPQVFAGQGGSISNGASGIATVDLRNLGPQRTLVLVNGRRVVPGDPRTPFTDLNFIPSSLIKRVDVLTGGASAVYGADAVAGVVNFVMDTNFSGFKIDGQYSLYNHDNRAGSSVTDPNTALGYGYPRGTSADGGTIDVTATIGAGFDDNRGHVVAYAGYRKINAVTQAKRDYSSCALTSNKASAVAANGLYACGGSATSAAGTFLTGDGRTLQVSGNSLVPGYSLYNYAPANYYQRPDERYTAGFFAHYDVSDAFKPYMEFMFMDDRTIAQIGASGDFGNTTSVSCDNAFLSAQEKATLCTNGNYVGQSVSATGVISGTPTVFTDANGVSYNEANVTILRRNVEGGPRQDDLQHTSYRGVIGAKGDLAKGLSYDASYQYGRTVYAETYYNDFSIKKLNNSLDVDASGTCRSVLNGTDTQCVPYDIFGGGVSADAINYLSTPGFERGQNTEQVANVNFTFLGGEYGLTSPLANEGIALNFGAEYRKETLSLSTDQEFTTGDLAGQGGATLGASGYLKAKEVFGELSVPLIQDRPFFQSLVFDAGYRHSKYNTDGTGYSLNPDGSITPYGGGNAFSTDTYKFELTWAPIRDIKLRASYNRAVRAPNVTELFGSRNVALDGATDPCSGFTITAADTACLAQGLSVGEVVKANPASQYNGFQGGNPDLTPEIATTKTFGAVFTPSFLRGFSATVDYFDIKVKNLIATYGADNILNQCMDGNSTFCGLIHRDSNGSLWLSPNGYVVDTNVNIGGLRTKGIDVAASYTQDIGKLGSLGFQLNGTWLDSLKTTLFGGVSYNCAGYYGVTCGTPSPKWRHTARLTWTLPSGPSLSLRWRYIGNTKIDYLSSDPDLNAPASVRPGSAKIKAYNYFDLTAQMPIANKYTFTVGVQNIFDKSPPLIGTDSLPAVYGNGNTFPQVYDALGRYLYVGITLDL
ncbi:TonB-dependent receptor domain-containing protein [Sphingomonas oryzagri]|uniref:TonB-dependent receptor n=1 Tax=Sphingomonas oryzagri TaxID=3042314 RepID=A0ABT6N7M1_9SPHN|nr:TonB-dependent receptor [Sphingomonas oryzagri]MDH7641085.1 TonB-dependent receptor [Sphingomonas oryzagri]